MLRGWEFGCSLYLCGFIGVCFWERCLEVFWSIYFYVYSSYLAIGVMGLGLSVLFLFVRRMYCFRFYIMNEKFLDFIFKIDCLSFFKEIKWK